VRSHHRQADGLNVGTVDFLDEEAAQELPAEFRHLGEVLQKLLPELGEQYAHVESRPGDASWVGYRLAEILPLTQESRQYCLELDEPLERLRLLDALISRQSV